MITEPSEFRQRLQEIQNSVKITFAHLPSNEPRFIIDANSREINIPFEFSFLGVVGDHKAETIYFEIDRYFDDVDLSEHTCVIQFINKNPETLKFNEGFYPVTTMDVNSIDGKIIFGWNIMNDVTQIAGDIHFSIRFYSIDSNNKFTYNFNTLTANSIILDTLDVKSTSIIEISPSELQAWNDKMNQMNLKAEQALQETSEILQTYEIASVDEINNYLGIEVVSYGRN